MAEEVLNDECMRCTDKECHDGENLCVYAMQKNSFYKDPRLYKGLEVIRLPTYKELEKENAELKADIRIRKIAMALSEQVERKYADMVLRQREVKENDQSESNNGNRSRGY